MNKNILARWQRQLDPIQLNKAFLSGVLGEIEVEMEDLEISIFFFSLLGKEKDGGIVIEIRFFIDKEMEIESSIFDQGKASWSQFRLPEEERTLVVGNLFTSPHLSSWEELVECTLSINPPWNSVIRRSDIRVWLVNRVVD